LASSVVTPLVKKLFVADGPGTGLVEKPVRISGFVSFRGEKRTVGEKELTKLAAELVARALRTGERPLAADEERDMFAPDRPGGIHLTELPQIQPLQRLAYWLIRNSQSEMDRDRAERIVADAGPLVLELLPGPEGLTDDEARAVVITASLIGTDTALPVLSRFRSHPSLLVRAQLAWTAHRFDTRRYAADVIAHLPPEDLYFCAHTADQLHALRDLGGRPMLQVVGDIDADDIRGTSRPNSSYATTVSCVI
jgi:hypothetical protein